MGCSVFCLLQCTSARYRTRSVRSACAWRPDQTRSCSASCWRRTRPEMSMWVGLQLCYLHSIMKILYTFDSKNAAHWALHTPYLQWHAFSMPELKNFLRILQREEEEHVKQIMQRYALARTRMQEALPGSTPGWGRHVGPWGRTWTYTSLCKRRMNESMEAA